MRGGLKCEHSQLFQEVCCKGKQRNGTVAGVGSQVKREFYFFKLGDQIAMMVQVRERRIAGIAISCGYRWKISQQNTNVIETSSL